MTDHIKHHFLHSDKSPFEEVCDTYLEANYDHAGKDQMEDMKGIFMAGAVSFVRLLETIKSSDIPEDEQKDILEGILKTAVFGAGGSLVGTRVESYTVDTKVAH